VLGDDFDFNDGDTVDDGGFGDGDDVCDAVDDDVENVDFGDFTEGG
jgi:hypothetical protein